MLLNKILVLLSVLIVAGCQSQVNADFEQRFAERLLESELETDDEVEMPLPEIEESAIEFQEDGEELFDNGFMKEADASQEDLKTDVARLGII